MKAKSRVGRHHTDSAPLLAHPPRTRLALTRTADRPGSERPRVSQVRRGLSGSTRRGEIVENARHQRTNDYPRVHSRAPWRTGALALATASNVCFAPTVIGLSGTRAPSPAPMCRRTSRSACTPEPASLSRSRGSCTTAVPLAWRRAEPARSPAGHARARRACPGSMAHGRGARCGPIRALRRVLRAPPALSPETSLRVFQRGKP